MALTDSTCRNTKAADRLQKLSYSGGLQLWVQPNGSRLWRFAYRIGGKQKLLALGSYPIVTLADARKARDEAKKLLVQGIDPSEQKREAKAAQIASSNSFRLIANEYVEKLRKEGRAAMTITKVKWLLDAAFSQIGDRHITDIKPAEILQLLRQIEARGNLEKARRLRSTIGSVFRYAIGTARAENDPTYALRDALLSPKVRHHPAITDTKALGALLRAIDGFDGQEATKGALQLMALLFPRPGELRAAEWPEFDLDAAIWTIPAARAKMRRDHRIPLSKQSIEILKFLKPLAGKSPFVLPGVRTNLRPISENTMNAALRRLGYSIDEATSHGFRATASTLLNESGKWSSDAIERQLAHIESNDVRRAYARGEHWEERVQMMQWWADHLDHVRTFGQVVSFTLATA